MRSNAQGQESAQTRRGTRRAAPLCILALALRFGQARRRTGRTPRELQAAAPAIWQQHEGTEGTIPGRRRPSCGPF